jgi:(E)-4-hydroxy-3-methylbut-2-enyl-diphosphate synthase
MDAEALKLLPGRYCNSLTDYSRFITREVTIGDVPMGGNNPIRIQSMTTTDTMDTIGTVEQSIRMIEAGCEYIRITAPSIKEAQNLANIKKELRCRGYTAPLVADIHFTPNAAEVAARIVEKVRVNPGNYADKKKFDILEYTDAQYEGELERINSKFTPLVNICKEYGTAMRIGTNHGSLSDRIMSRYGDTPQGMVESAMEFIRMCEALNYYNLCISMKSSNPQVMVQAYRLLVQTMVAENMNYPLHLGVTEAGDGEDGRIKSAVGIGTLLEDGLGDTVRVSLTEEPEAEAPVAIALVERYSARSRKLQNQNFRTRNQDLGQFLTTDNQQPTTHSPYEYKKRETYEANAFIGGHMVPRVVVDLSKENLKDPAVLNAAGYLYSAMLDKYNMADQSVDFAYMGDQLPSFNFPGNLKQLYNYNTWKTLANKTNAHPLFTLQEYVNADDRTSTLNLVRITNADLDTDLFGQIELDNKLVFVLETDELHGMADQRAFFFKMEEFGLNVPVIVKRSYTFEENQELGIKNQDENKSEIEHPKSEIKEPTTEMLTTELQLYAATDMGALLVDGFGDGIWIDAPQLPTNIITSTAFGILQATRSRISKTEYISCPSCGRTLFDLQETTQLIRSRTSHLKGLKIGIMGCIVNGPGEMADADYGYVGAGPGKITLYRGKEVVKKNVNTSIAVDELINIIQGDGNWVEPVI